MWIFSRSPWQKSYSQSCRKISLFLCVISLRIKSCFLFFFFSSSTWSSCYSSINFQSETNPFSFWHLKRPLRWSVRLTIFVAASMSGKTSEGICMQLIILPCQVTDPPNESTPKFDIREAVQFAFWFDTLAWKLSLLALCLMRSSLVVWWF